MPKVIQTQPGPLETTALLKQSSRLSSSSISSSIRSVSSLPELDIIHHISSFRINRYKQQNSYLSNDYEDMLIYNLDDQLMFSIEFEESSGYFSTQMKFSVVSSNKIGVGSIQRVCGFMRPPVFEILNWDGGHLFSMGAPKTSGIKSYDFTRKYEVISNDGKGVSTIVKARKTISMKYNASEPLQLRDKTLILALGFILDLLKDEET